MQFSKIFVSAFAALAAAAPATSKVEERELAPRTLLSADQLLAINGGVFNVNSVSYLLSINGLGVDVLDPLLVALASQGLNLNVVSPIFQADVLNANAIALAANILFMNNLFRQGVFTGTSLANLVFPEITFDNLQQAAFNDLSTFINPSSLGNINNIAAQNVIITKE